jgi:hypothetical protein
VEKNKAQDSRKAEIFRIKKAGNLQHCAGDKIEKNEMGWACGAYG